MKHFMFGLLALLVVSVVQPAQASVHTVDGKQTVYFAGRTQSELGAIAATANPAAFGTPFLNGDIADFSLTSPEAIGVSGFSSISITADGLWSHTPSLGTGPEGKVSTSITSEPEYGLFGVSLLNARLNMLVGVFLSDDVPDPGSTPASLDAIAGDNMTSPLLNQTFAIGSSLEDILVPVGATRLYLGLHNGWEWNNNAGSVTASIHGVPEPTTIVIWSLLATLGLSVGWRRHRRK